LTRIKAGSPFPRLTAGHEACPCARTELTISSEDGNYHPAQNADFKKPQFCNKIVHCNKIVTCNEIPNINIAFTTKNNLSRLLQNKNQKHTTSDPYSKNGVYQLTCSTCGKQYVGQTDRAFHTRYQEHEREYRYNAQKPNFAKHFIEEKHPFPPINDCMKIQQHIDKGPMLNTVDKFYIYQETANNNQLNDMSTITPNAVLDTVLRHQ
jgi:hypothetical protein